MDQEIARQEHQVELLRQPVADSPLVNRLKARGLLR